MIRPSAPLVASILAVAWLIAQGLRLPLLALATTVAGLWACAAVARRPSAAGLHLALAAVLSPLAAGLLLLLGPYRSGPRALLVQIALLLALAPAAPLLYAWTFTSRRGSRR